VEKLTRVWLKLSLQRYNDETLATLEKKKKKKGGNEEKMGALAKRLRMNRDGSLKGGKQVNKVGVTQKKIFRTRG